MPSSKIHNVGFYKPQAKAIYSMALEKSKDKLAIARSDSSLEIWNLTHLPFIEKTIPPMLQNCSIEGLCWCDNRLFSVGLHGWLVEYDLYTLGIKNKWAVTGEAATCLDSNKSQIAIGTEQGYVNIFQVNEEGVQFEKFLDKQEGRIICLKYDKTGEFVLGGSINAIRIWNVKTGHAIHKMVLGRSEAKKDTVVWCLEVLSDFTIFSGDSRGVLTLWDGKLGAQIETYQSHKADIVALCIDEKEESIYSAGVDPLISNYEKVNVGSNVKWVKSIQRKIHDHDVRSMVFHKGKLYSGGVDSYLVCSYHPPKTLIKYAPILQNPCVCSRKNRILLRYSKHIEVWELGQAQKTADTYKGMLELRTKPKKLVLIQKVGKNWAGEEETEGITCASISASGRWVFMGTSTGFSLYQLGQTIERNKSKSFSKIDDLDDSNVACVQAAFNDKYNQVIVALSTGNLIVYDLEDDSPFISQRIEKNQDYLRDTISILSVSSCGKYFTAADNMSNIVVFYRQSDGYTFNCKLPRYPAAPTALNVNSLSSCIIVAYADNKIREYSLINKRLTNFSSKLQSSSGWKLKTHPIKNVVFDTRDKNMVLLHDDNNIAVVKRDGGSANSGTPLSKAAKIKNADETINNSLTNGDHSEEELKIKTIQKYKHLVHLDSISEGELVAVEVNPLSILEQLPPAFAQKTFGTK